MEFRNQIIKDRIEVLENTSERLIFRTYLEPKGGQTQLHYHSKIHEKFIIVRGSLNLIINDSEEILKENQEKTILPKTNHMFFNSSENQVVFDVEILHPNNFLKALQIFYGLVEKGSTNKKGIPKNIFHTAIGIKMMGAFSPKIPMVIQKIGIFILNLLGEFFGIKKKLLEKYC